MHILKYFDRNFLNLSDKSWNDFFEVFRNNFVEVLEIFSETSRRFHTFLLELSRNYRITSTPKNLAFIKTFPRNWEFFKSIFGGSLFPVNPSRFLGLGLSGSLSFTTFYYGFRGHSASPLFLRVMMTFSLGPRIMPWYSYRAYFYTQMHVLHRHSKTPVFNCPQRLQFYLPCLRGQVLLSSVPSVP